MPIQSCKRKSHLIGSLICLVVFFLLSSISAVQATTPDNQDKPKSALSVKIDPLVELISIIFRLAGSFEYNQGRVSSYNDDISRHFKPVLDHPVIQMARNLRQTQGVSFDACMSFAIHLDDIESLNERSPFDGENIHLDARWRPEEAREFLKQVRDFKNESKFDEFITDHQDFYAIIEKRMRSFLDEHADLNWFEQFFGVKPTAPFTVIPALVNGGANYGPKFVAPDGSEHLYAILGTWLVDEEGVPDFDKRFLGTVVHEFNHSFVNHLVEKIGRAHV